MIVTDLFLGTLFPAPGIKRLIVSREITSFALQPISKIVRL
jgi:hypothetical protein